MVYWTNSVRSSPTSATTDSWQYKREFEIWLPGAEEPDRRLISGFEDTVDSGNSLLDALNELGADGWELVCKETTGSAVGESRGWPEASWPTAATWYLKRPIP